MERGIIKWRPFNSVINTKKMLEEESLNQHYIEMPELSEEQLYYIQNKIEFSYYSKIKVTINYFKNNHIFKITGQIKKIDNVNHLIKLNDNTTLFFNQIINIQ